MSPVPAMPPSLAALMERDRETTLEALENLARDPEIEPSLRVEARWLLERLLSQRLPCH